MNQTKSPTTTKEFARQLRSEQTEAEQKIWSVLRDRRLQGIKFRRQHPMPPYVLDFYCHSAKLAIELDGSQHIEQESYDQQRTEFLSQQGILVLRFWNHDVLQRREAVLETIWKTLRERGVL
jgi:very-short-patch-repair endonuclease